MSQAAPSPVLDVEVNATSGAYRVVLNGRTWLRSGTLRAHINGEWHATRAGGGRDNATCGAARHGMDQTGGKFLDDLPVSPDEASCCAACLAQGGCDAWVRGVPDGSNASASPHCFLIKGAKGTTIRSDRTVGFVDSSHPPLPGTIALEGGGGGSGSVAWANGTDRFGAFRSAVLSWRATSSAKAVAHFDTEFRAYEGGRALLLRQSLPAGGAGTAYRNVSQLDKNILLVEPFLHFPSFSVADTAEDNTFARGAGWATWQGTQISRGFLPAGAGAPPAANLGLDSGPVVVLEPAAAGGAAVMVAPTTHFKGAVQVRTSVGGGGGSGGGSGGSGGGAADADWVAGVSGEVKFVPTGFSHETMLFAGDGVTDTVLGWGALMRAALNTSKVPDLVTQKVGYWTDNGAFYYGKAYQPKKGPTYNYDLSCCTKSKLLAAHADLAADGLPMSYLQLDDWWYSGAKPAQGGVRGVKCVDKWQLPENTYPGGLDALRGDYGAPFLLYGPYFCTKNQWNQTLVPAGGSAGVPGGGRAASAAFYEEVFAYALAHGGFAYEVDFMNELYLSIPEFRTVLDAATEWQAGMNDAAGATGLTVQFCMMHPSDLLSTLQFPHVTNGRASNDYAYAMNWFVGHSSLLFEAVGLRPSKDGFWSADGQAHQRGFDKTLTNPGHDGELNAILATMSTGPVGPADGAGQHNATRLRRTCGADGRILSTARPLTPIDATYHSLIEGGGGPRNISAAAVWTANSHPAGPYGDPADGATAAPLSWHVLGVDAVGGVDVLRGDLFPAPGAEQLLALRDFHRAMPCEAGADAVTSGCVSALKQPAGGSDGGDLLLTLDGGTSWPFGTHMTQLYTVSPLVAGEWGLLGELEKFVPISHARFGGVRASAAGLSATVSGAAGEVVVVTALQPAGAASWTVATQNVTVAANGTGLLCLPALSC